MLCRVQSRYSRLTASMDKYTFYFSICNSDLRHVPCGVGLLKSQFLLTFFFSLCNSKVWMKVKLCFSVLQLSDCATMIHLFMHAFNKLTVFIYFQNPFYNHRRTFLSCRSTWSGVTEMCITSFTSPPHGWKVWRVFQAGLFLLLCNTVKYL